MTPVQSDGWESTERIIIHSVIHWRWRWGDKRQCIIHFNSPPTSLWVVEGVWEKGDHFIFRYIFRKDFHLFSDIFIITIRLFSFILVYSRLNSHFYRYAIVHNSTAVNVWCGLVTVEKWFTQRHICDTDWEPDISVENHHWKYAYRKALSRLYFPQHQWTFLI
jgi:hypothetical protein